MTRKLEDYIPVVKEDGIVTDKDATFGGNLTVSGDITLDDITLDDISATGGVTSSSATAGVGYATGAGGAVTQATNKSTGVTLNTVAGTITTHAAELAAAAEVTFVVTNSAVAITDVVALSIQSGGTPGEYQATVSTVAAGSFHITLANLSGSAASDAVLINFAVIKAVAA